MKGFRFDDKGESIKKKANRSEAKLAKKVGGHKQPASGAPQGCKGDVKLKEYLIDQKATGHMSTSVKVGDLQKIQKEADGSGREPVLVLKFENVKVIEKEWAVIPLALFMELKGDE